MLNTMNTQIAHNKPSNQSEYQAGLMDGTRYRADGHIELMQKYESGTKDYRMGFDASAVHPRALDPHFAS